MTKSRQSADFAAGGPQVAGKNACINGGMDIWQRGTSFTNVNGYAVDRWYVNRNGAVTGCTASQSTDVPDGFQFSLKTQRVAGNTGTQSIDMYYGLESKDSYRFRSQTVILSFYAKVGANYSGGASGLTARILSGTATDASPFSGSTTVATSSPALTTTWTRFTLTGTFGASITQAFVQLGWSPTGTAGADDSVFITGVQLELGSYATSFSRTGGTIQGELAACQRYYEKSYPTDTALGTVDETYATWTSANAGDTSLVNGTAYFKVTKRIQPTITIYNTSSGTTGSFLATSTSYTVSSVATGTHGIGRVYATTGMTANTYVRFHWTASAEL